MKLYSTVRSERASKGQGGNDYLNIEIKDGQQQIIATVHIKTFKNGTATMIWHNYLTALETVSTFKPLDDKQKAISNK